MAKRYGRNQRRAHREEIAELRHRLYGVWGEPSELLQRIDHLRHCSMTVYKQDDRGLLADDVTISYRELRSKDFETLVRAYEDGVILVHGDMCLYPVKVSADDEYGLYYVGTQDYPGERMIAEQHITAEFKRVAAPRML